MKPCKNCEKCLKANKELFGFAILFFCGMLLFLILWEFSLDNSSSIQIPDGYKIVNVTECHNETNKITIYCPDFIISWTEKDAVDFINNKAKIVSPICKVIYGNQTICTQTSQQYEDVCLEWEYGCPNGYKQTDKNCMTVSGHFISVQDCCLNKDNAIKKIPICTKIQRTYILEKT